MTIKSQKFDYRLLISKSNKYTYAQVINADWSIICGMSDAMISQQWKVAKALELWKSIAAICKAKGIISVVFDRNGYIYHGRVKALADWAREWGLVF